MRIARLPDSPLKSNHLTRSNGSFSSMVAGSVDMDSLRRHPSASEAANRCIDAFNYAFQNTSHSPQAFSLLEDELARFSLWTANMNVFAGARASLDYRLREAPDVHGVATGLLEALEYELRECTYSVNIPSKKLKCCGWRTSAES